MSSIISLPFIIGIAIHGLLTVYQFHIARTFTGNFKDKLYYYNAHVISLIPIILYLYKVLNIYAYPYTERLFLEVFYIEWAMTSPLILLNTGRLIQIPVYKYILLSLLDSLMILSGYISYIFENPAVVYLSYGIGCLCFMILNFIFISQLKLCSPRANQKFLHPPASLYRDRIRYRIFRAIVSSIVVSWSLYPVVYILYKLGILALETTVWVFVGLDVATKGVFTNLLLGSREIYRTPSSCLGFLTRKMFQVHPLEVRISENNLEEIVSRNRTNSEPKTVIYSTFSRGEYVGTLATIHEKPQQKPNTPTNIVVETIEE